MTPHLRTASFACFAGTFLLLIIGCAVPDSDFRLKKAESDRDEMRAARDDQRARAITLQERLDLAQRELTAARAETGSLRDRVAVLEDSCSRLRKLVEERAEAPPQRPDVPATDLPAALDQALAKFAAENDRVDYDRGRSAVTFESDKLFAGGSDELLPAAQPLVRSLGGLLARQVTPEWEVVVVGHTDDAPILHGETRTQHATNWHLSVHRAIRVKDMLVAAGLAESRVGVMGYGAMRPIDRDRARNRRVEIFIVRKGSVRPMSERG